MWPLIFKYAAGITSGLSFFAFVAALYVWLQSRQREDSILQTIKGEGVVDTQTVVRILKEFASDEHRIKALQAMLKYDEGRAKGVVEKVNRVDVGNFSLNAQAHATHRLLIAGFFLIALAGLSFARTHWIWDGETAINFTGPDTNKPPYVVPAAEYLSRFGITITDVTPGSEVIIQGDYTTGGHNAFGTDSHNALTQRPCNGPVGFRLNLPKPVSHVSVRRASLISNHNGITHPAWSVCAFNGNEQLACKGEELLRRFVNEPDREFSIEGQSITSLKFDSDYRLNGQIPFAAFCGVLIEDLKLKP